MKRFIPTLLKSLLGLVIIFFSFILVCNAWVYYSTKGQIIESLEDIPNKEVALVLGTSPKLMTGSPNPYFHERIGLAAELLKKGKVKSILVSGDHRTKYYNEPKKMLDALIELDIPEEKITLDHSGLRTFDSIIRCKKVFGNNDIIVITQPFHSHRALFISNYYKMDAISFSQTDIPANFSYKVKVREYLARALAVLDIYILHSDFKQISKQ